MMPSVERAEANVYETGLPYSHFRPVLVHRRQLGFSSPHLTLRILGWGQYLAGRSHRRAYLQVLQPSRDLTGPRDGEETGMEDRENIECWSPSG